MHLILAIHRWIPTRQLDDERADDLVWALLWPWAVTFGLALGGWGWLVMRWLASG